jgi:hypothetical protein
MVKFVVQFSDRPEIGVPAFDTPFYISSDNEDASPANNTARVFVGVPDLIVTSFTVAPLPLKADTPLTFAVVMKNQGTGMAWNPDVQTGFWIDIFTAPITSYPFDRYSEIGVYTSVSALAPGATYTLVITRTGSLKPIQFSEQALDALSGFYVKVDNHADNPYGLVPESDEWNNVGPPISAQAGLYFIYLPLVERQ